MKENEKNNKLSKNDLENVAGGEVIYVRYKEDGTPDYRINDDETEQTYDPATDEWSEKIGSWRAFVYCEEGVLPSYRLEYRTGYSVFALVFHAV